MIRRFTGWHMLGVMLAMFGVIITVNFIMAGYAVRTFGGTVVDISYVASQHYNRWLAEARAQDRLGWTLDVTLDAGRRLHIGTHTAAGPLADATVSAVARHPLGRAPERTIAFTADAQGNHVAAQPLPPGRWLIRIDVRSGGHVAHFLDDVPA